VQVEEMRNIERSVESEVLTDSEFPTVLKNCEMIVENGH
jgi:hypothetical protein